MTSRNCSNCGTSSDTCNCTVNSGSGIVVTGIGSAVSPYVVTNNVQTLDSTSIDFTGVGTTSSKLTASVIVDPDGGLEITADGLALKDECTEVMCLDADGTPIGFKKTTGAGTVTYYNTSGVSQGSTIPVGWGLCDCAGDGTGGATVTSADDVVYVSGTNAVSLNSKVSRVVTTALSPASVNPNAVGIQALSSGSATITNPSSTHEMNVIIMAQMHNCSWIMAGVSSTVNNWTLYDPGSLQPLFGATSTTGGLESFSQGNCAYGIGTTTIAAGASYTVSVTQQFVVNSTSGHGSNQALHGYGGIVLMGVIK
jgi:hypothetical protein